MGEKNCFRESETGGLKKLKIKGNYDSVLKE